MLNGGGGEATRGDAGVRGDTWTLCSDVVVMVMESRGGTVPPGVRVETERLLEQGLAVSVHTVLAHSACQGCCCAATRVVEVWTLSIDKRATSTTSKVATDVNGCSATSTTTTRGLQPMFLKNAVRSHLHFSQLNAWIADSGGRMPDGIAVAYRSVCRLSLLDSLDSDWSSSLHSHTFPVCDLDQQRRLTVTVQWAINDHIPTLPTCGDPLSPTTFDAAPEDAWLNADCSSSRLSYSSSSSNSQLSPPSFSPQSPHFFVSSDDDAYRRPMIRRRARNTSRTILMGGGEVMETSEMESLSEFLASASLSVAARTPRKDLRPKKGGGGGRRPMSSFSFNKTTGLPLNSSPAPLKRNERSFGYDQRLGSVRSALYGDDGASSDSDSGGLVMCKSAPASTGLLCNFEESALNGRLEPLATLDGFYLQLASSGVFCSPHVTLPVTTFFFNLSDDAAEPSPYLGHCSLESLGRRGYHIPKKGTLQTTLFNPQDTVVMMFVVKFDLGDMPASSQTFIRQRTFFMPVDCPLEKARRSWLRYLIHLRFATCRSGKLYLHTDIRMLFSRKSDLDSFNSHQRRTGGEFDGFKTTTAERDNEFELRTFTEMPHKPKYSPRK